MDKKEYLSVINETIANYSDRFLEYEKYLKLFLGSYENEDMSERKSRNRSAIFVPKIYSIIKRKVSSLYDTYFANDSIIDVDFFGYGDEGLAEKLSKVIEYSAKTKPFASELISVFYDFYIFGLGVCRLRYDKGVIVERVAPNEVFFDLNAKSLNDINYLVHKIYLTKERIEQLQKTLFDESFDVLKLEYDINILDKFKRVIVYDFYELIDGVWHLSSYSGSECLRFQKRLNLLPFSFGYAIPNISLKLADEDFSLSNLFGDSECRILEPLQMELNQIRNQQRDGVRFQLDPRVIKTNASGFNDYDWDISGPGDIITVNKLNEFSYAPTPVLNESNQELKNIDLELQEASGVTAYNSGISRAGMLNQTATGMSILTSEGNSKIASEIRTINETFFKRFADIYARLVYMHTEVEVFQKVNETTDITINRDSFDFNISIKVGMNSDNKELKKQRLLEALQVAGAINPIASNVILKELISLLINPETAKAIEIETMNLQQQGGANAI